MAEATARQSLYGTAPRRIELLGDKKERPESAMHIIEFPGGAIELSRLEDGTYWAHIIVNRRWADRSQNGSFGAIGEVIASRIDRGPGDPQGLQDLHNMQDIQQIAVLIKATKPETSHD